jgi:hypothetical protein
MQFTFFVSMRKSQFPWRPWRLGGWLHQEIGCVLAAISADVVAYVGTNIYEFGGAIDQGIAMVGERQRYQPPSRDTAPDIAENHRILKQLTRSRGGKNNWTVTVRAT